MLEKIDINPVPMDFGNIDQAVRARAGVVPVTTHNHGIIAMSNDVPEIYYKIYLDMNRKEGFCSCPDFKYRKARQGKPCKHIAAVMDIINRGD